MMRLVVASLGVSALLPTIALAQSAAPSTRRLVEVGAFAGWAFHSDNAFRTTTPTLGASVEAAINQRLAVRVVFDRASWPGHVPATVGGSLTANSIRFEGVRYQWPRGDFNAYTALGAGLYRVSAPSGHANGTLFTVSGAVGILHDLPRGALFGELALALPRGSTFGVPGRLTVGYRWRP